MKSLLSRFHDFYNADAGLFNLGVAPTALACLGMVLALNGCSKPGQDAGSAAANIVQAVAPSKATILPANQRSPHFMKVNEHLDLGGTVYVYIDIDGDAEKLATAMKGLLSDVATAQPQIAPFVQQDIAGIFQVLGLTDIKAIGISSYNDGSGYFHNKAFFYTAGQKHGLLAGLGGPVAPFARIGLAPKDTDLYYETEMDLPEIYKTVRAVVSKVGGDTTSNLMEVQLQKAGEAAAFSLLGLINGWKGHTTVVARLSEVESTTIPSGSGEGYSFPTPSILLRVDGIGQVVDAALSKSSMLTRAVSNGVTIYQSKQPMHLQGISPVLVVDGEAFYVASNLAFLNECRGLTESGLAQAPEFKEAASHIEGKATV
jgi:hypothetical protein